MSMRRTKHVLVKCFVSVCLLILVCIELHTGQLRGHFTPEQLLDDVIECMKEEETSDLALNTAGLEVEVVIGKLNKYLQELNQKIAAVEVLDGVNVTEQVTIVLLQLLNSETTLNNLQRVLASIAELYPGIQVNVGLKTRYGLPALKNKTAGFQAEIEWYIFKKHTSPVVMWNMMAANVYTEFMLVAQDLVDFSNSTSLEDMVYMLTTTDVLAVGGSYRIKQGDWTTGCYEFKQLPYTLKVYSRHSTSLYGCIKCHYIDGPLLLRTSSFKLEEHFSEHEAFLKFFLQSFTEHEKPQFSILCPEMMYLTAKHKTRLGLTTKKQLQPLSRKQQLDTFIFPENSFFFDCTEAGLHCNMFSILKKGISLPKCCQRKHLAALHLLSNFLRAKKIHYHLLGGTNLAAVKFQRLSDWDIDTDINAEVRVHSLMAAEKRYFTKNGFNLWLYPQNPKVYIDVDNYNVEIFSWNNSNNVMGLPEDLRTKPTLVRLEHVWLRSRSNPGLDVYLYFKPGLFKHTVSWKALNASIFGPFPQGYFPPCYNKHQNCLDHFPTDGNLGFSA